MRNYLHADEVPMPSLVDSIYHSQCVLLFSVTYSILFLPYFHGNTIGMVACKILLFLNHLETTLLFLLLLVASVKRNLGQNVQNRECFLTTVRG